MEPRIQYAKTSDGVSIAYWTLGEGEPLVWINSMVTNHIQMEWHVQAFRAWYEPLVATRRLIRYDPRGFGLSDREVQHLAEGRQYDLQAVVDRVGLDSFALIGVVTGGQTAIEYAAEHPEQVSHLILMDPYARGADIAANPRIKLLEEMLAEDFEMYSMTVAAENFGLVGEDAHGFAEVVRTSVSQETLMELYRARRADDVTELLSRVEAPTLVIRHDGLRNLTMNMARDLVTGIPNARLLVVHGKFAESTDEIIAAIQEFLGDAEAASTADRPAAGGLVTILFTDMRSSAALTQRLGDAKAQEVRRAHNGIVRSALSANGGSEIKHTGDGIMASFTTASSGLECAIAIQRGVAAHVEEHPDSPLGLYIGLNAGEPIAEERDLFGTSVDLAKRICDHAEPGQILAADVVRQLAAGKDFLFTELGETELRGFEDPVRLYEVRWKA